MNQSKDESFSGPLRTSCSTSSAAATAGIASLQSALNFCHGQIRFNLCLLDRVVLEHGDSPLPYRDPRASALIDFFSNWTHRLHCVEDTSVFPALMESVPGSDPVCLRELCDHLTAEHVAIELLWKHLRQGLRPDGHYEIISDVPRTTARFLAIYQEHLENERRELLPMTSRLIPEDQGICLVQALHECGLLLPE